MGRPGARRLLLLAACLGLCGPRSALGASFYGESYVELSVDEVSSELSLQLQFQTSKPHGLLFLAAGKIDYCIIELLSGTLQVKVNLGSGEQVLLSEHRLRMDDMVWHSVELNYVRNDIVLVTDRHHRTIAHLPGGMRNFTFHLGIYIGGRGGLDVPYLDIKIPSFRGCVEDVIFNQREILTSLRSYPGFKKVYDVSPGCTEEFFAGEDEAISFFSSRSYVSFPEWKVQGEGTLRLAVRTGSPQALLLLQSGQEGECVALEIHEGLLNAYVGRREAQTRLSSLSLVSDNKWHTIQLRVTGRHLDLKVDEQGVRTSLALRSKPFVSEGPLFVGGLAQRVGEDVKRFQLASLAGKSARGIALKGCLSGLEANSEKRALRDALVSKDISVGCKTESIGPAQPSMIVGDPLQSTPSPSTAVPASGTSSLQGESSEFWVLNDLEVQEGGRARLEHRHMKVNMELMDVAVNYSQILFKIKDLPAHGVLQMDISPQREMEVFSMFDLRQGKVWYIHDGSEEPTDSFTFWLFSDSKKDMPSFPQAYGARAVSITVVPVNDAPSLKLPEGDLLLVLENSKKRLTPNLIQVSDPDTDSSLLRISVLGNSHSDTGFLEDANEPGRPIDGFTHEDLRDGNIYYVHRGHQYSRLVLRASDGELVSNTVVLRVMAVPWDFEVVNRTGVVVPQGSAIVITQNNLSVEVNGEPQDMGARYDITRPPRFGQIQLQGSNGEWNEVHTFSQRSVDQRRVRYYSTFQKLQRENITDHFQFQVNVAGKVSGELVFPVAVQWLKFTLQKNVPLDISDGNKTVLNSDHLQAATEGVEIAEGELHFKLLTPPKKGKLLLGHKILKKGSVFSQKNITDSVIMYEAHGRPRADSWDTFRFLIVAKHIESKHHTFRINLQADKTHITLTNTGLFIKEGEGKLITRSDLFVQILDNRTFRYEVTESPQHGKLTLLSSSASLGSNQSIISFTNQDIAGGKLMYVHDDSETRRDEFSVVASATDPGQEGVVRGPLSTEIKVIVSVELKNDEKPVRVVDEIFHVVRGGQRLLTLDNLCHHDPDLDFDDGQLLYTRRAIPNGDLVQASEPTQKLYQFRQEDLQAGRVLFRHRGEDSARFLLLVTDGVHHTASLFEVRASEPYVHVVNNTGLLVHRGKDSRLTTANLSVTTNQDVRTDQEVEFRIVRPPQHGKVLVNDSMCHSFSQRDLKQGRVIFRHHGNGSFDVFNLRVTVKGIHTDVGVWVHVSSESHQHPKETLHSKTLVVEEGKPVRLSRERLQAGDEDSLPSEAVFIVRRPPAHGYLQKSTPPEEGSLDVDERCPVTFTQQEVDAGSILYVQTAPGQPRDHFSLDVTEDSQIVSRMEILLDIIPKWIPLEVKNITVQEGVSMALLEDHLQTPSKYFESLDLEFVLLEPPKHGHVENSNFPGGKLKKFTRKQVESKLVRYVHDDSEEPLDSFTILANSSELGKQSLPQTIFVTVDSVNDEAPVITASKILQVWANSVTELSSSDFCAEDGDSFPKDLVYWVTLPSNGHLALKSFPEKSIWHFTQAQINDGQLVFVHSGALSGEFSFQVTDGRNSAPRQIISVTARTLVLSLKVNRGLSVFPGSTKPLSSRDLEAGTNDDNTGNRTVTFTVVSSPRLGRLLRINPDNHREDVSVFTQDLVNEGLILYQHVDLENTGWTVEDYFTFTVSSPPAVLGPEEFRVTISYEINEPGRQSRLLANTGAAVKEGDRVLIDQSKLDASNLLLQLPEAQRSSYEIWFQVTSLPHHGTIMVGERNVTAGKPNFSQFIVNKFGITYLHDDSESLADNFTFVVWPNQKSKPTHKPETGFLEEMFNISVTPVNDQAPELKTKGLRLKVLQGTKMVVGPEVLKVEDLDSPPNEITYAVIRHPNNGFLAMAQDLQVPAQHFTQADIDKSQVWFIQDGGPSSGAFYFSVTDGEHRPLYKLFHLDVIAVSITLVNRTDLLIPQGETTVPITSTHLSAVTSGKNSPITYRVTRPLQHGHLQMENQAVTCFGQEDLDSGRLSYHMTNLTASEDQLQFSLFTPQSNLTGQTLGIRVQPLLQVTSDLPIFYREARQLRREDLDATELADMTNSEPTFEVIKPPIHGRLRRRAVDSYEEEEVTLFTQKDIDQGVLVLEPHANLTGTDTVNDSFTFLLRADHVQPATGSLSFTIVPSDPWLVPTFTPDGPLLATGDNFMTSVFSPEKPTAPSGPSTHMESQTGWLGADPRGQQSVDGEISPTRVIWLQAATKVSPRRPSEPRESSYPLTVIIPLAAVSLLLVVTTVALCVWLLGRREEKRKPLIKPQTSLEPTSPNYRPERSVTIPTVTVTPLIRSPSSASPNVFRAPRYEQVASPEAEPMKACSPWETWANLGPDMAKLCRQSNPALKHKQYWV